MESCGIEEIRETFNWERSISQETSPPQQRKSSPVREKDLITAPQIKLIYTLGKQLRMAEDDIFEMVLAQYHTREIGELSKKEGSDCKRWRKSVQLNWGSSNASQAQ